ncbi:uncharacterized protein LOC124978867 isoform X5 [Sciurus carolinensis]|uniref:uncharacterized protein LOC124978867 isoform X5 n=1 Tax=Sciurus carolinensis TaxID=30640 RepID=UPI001FB2854D|nr:uncharacterized protein LOC124978867 isoform X5 [Sciurus carolinensis]
MGTAGQECSQPVLTSNPNPPRCEERLPWPPPLGGPADASGATGASPWQPCQASLSCFYSTSARPPSLANQPYILLVFQHQRKRAQLFDFPPSLWQQLLRLHWPLPFSQAWNVAVHNPRFSRHSPATQSPCTKWLLTQRHHELTRRRWLV